MARSLKDRIDNLNQIAGGINQLHWGTSEKGYPTYVLFLGWYPKFSTNSFAEAKAEAIRIKNSIIHS